MTGGSGTPYPLSHAWGYFTAPRSLGTLEPLIRRPLAATIYMMLLCRVRHEPGLVMGSHGQEMLERGQCLAGTGELAERIGTNRSAVRRAIGWLIDMGLIFRDSTQRGSIITVREYGEFSKDRRNDDQAATQRQHSLDTAAAQLRHSGSTAAATNERENGRTGEPNNGRTENPIAHPEGEPETFDFEAVYSCYPRKVGKTRGRSLFTTKVRSEATYAQCLSAAKEMGRLWTGTTKEQRKFCPQFDTWMSKDRWKDDEQIGPSTDAERDIRFGHHFLSEDEEYTQDGVVEDF